MANSDLQVGPTNTPSATTFSITVHADNGAGSTADHTFTITATAPTAGSLINALTGNSLANALTGNFLEAA